MAVEFDNDNFAPHRYQSRVVLGHAATPSLSGFFIKIGVVKNETQAYKFLVFLIIVCIIAAIAVYYFFVANSGHAPVLASTIYGTQ
jgi:hypothetical protein